jgi:hypothetical protein
LHGGQRVQLPERAEAFFGSHNIPLAWHEFTHLRRQLAGLRRLKGEGAHRKLPIRPPLLLRFARRLPPGSRWLAVFTCCVVGVFGMLRRSNLLPGSLSLFGQEKHLTRADITIDPATYALHARVRFSKVLQFQDRVHVVVIAGAPRPGAPLDPVALWRGYCAAVPAPPDAPAFCYFGADGRLCPLTFSLLAEGIKALVAAAGLDPAEFSTHSLRRGGATWAFQQNVHTLLIKATGDWRSDAYQAYLTLGAPEKLQCTPAMLRALV